MLSWDDHKRWRISPLRPDEIRHNDVVRTIESWQQSHPDAFTVEQLGQSVKGRSVSMLKLGQGTRSVLAWSQMHGDEPTHTAALFDLINFLLKSPEHPTASAILAGCQLQLIPMLNPDGAEQWTRRNAQGIDINRDALQLQSPEGRILRTVVDALQPNYALNLHNQRPRTTVGQSQQVASFAVLSPPVDECDSSTANVVQAKRLGGYLAEVVAPYCPGPVARYNADFMPRCFGEWVQQQGAATLTIEAGGWSTFEMEPLVQLHYWGLVKCLEAIATQNFDDVAPSSYESLPRTGDHDLFDHLIRGAAVWTGSQDEPFRVDVGINLQCPDPTSQPGEIVDLGDLLVSTGKLLTDEPNLTCLAGRIAWQPDVSPTQLPSQNVTKQLISQAVTTVLGQVDLADGRQVDRFATLSKRLDLPINIGFLARVSDWSSPVRDRLIRTISSGILGVIAEGLPAEAESYLKWFKVPTISLDTLSSWSIDFVSYADCAAKTYQCAELLALANRGAIRIGAAADIALLNTRESHAGTEPSIQDALHQLFLGGSLVFDEGRFTDALPGELVKRRCRD